MNKLLRRVRMLPSGQEASALLPVCQCEGTAEPAVEHNRRGEPYWTPGRRGPPGGVCGACCCAIPSETELGR